MSNIHDWCISRQLWWGHRIPAWYCDGVRRDHRRARATRRRARRAAAPSCVQDEDVLDTWFSSALWPFSTLGWPEQDARAADVLPDQRAGDRLRHPLLLGRPHDDDGPALHGEGAVPHGVPARDRRRRERREDVEGEGQRHRSARRRPRRDARAAARSAPTPRTAPEAALKNIKKNFPEGHPADRAPTRCASRSRR